MALDRGRLLLERTRIQCSVGSDIGELLLNLRDQLCNHLHHPFEVRVSPCCRTAKRRQDVAHVVLALDHHPIGEDEMTVPVSRYGEQLPRPPSAQMLVDRARDSVIGYIARVVIHY